MPRSERVLLDSNCFVYLLDDPTSARARYLTTEVFGPAQTGRLQLYAATLTAAELLSLARGTDEARRSALSSALRALPLTWVDLDLGLAEAAASLRRLKGLTLPDAIIAATAASLGAALLTNDRRFAKAVERALLLDDVIS